MRVIVGVTGGIAAYKAVQLVRHLVLEGHDVHVVPTEDALRFVGQPTWEAISRNPVTASVHDDVAQVRHVALGRDADLVIVAPATANFLAKMASGLADDLLGTTLLATKAPVVVAPAMHTDMWRHPATVENVAVLRRRRIHVVGPATGALTGDDSGPGRMAEPDEIAHRALAIVAPDADLAGLRVAVSAGGTREPLDPVRFIGNRSSGRQGLAMALAAADRGADVVFVAAHVDADVLSDARHPRIRLERAGTAAELGAAMTVAAADSDVIVMAAAVADFRPSEVVAKKVTKESAGETLSLDLVRTDDILAGLCAHRLPGQTLIGFAAETAADPDELVARGRSKRARKGADLLAVNEVGWLKGFEAADNAIVVIGPDDAVVARASGTKRAVADALWNVIVSARAASE